MYNPQLDTFIQVAEAGSFNKAANKMYITSTAVIKQINLLEERIGVPLFIRSHRGLKLTEGGKLLYHDARYLIDYCIGSVQNIREAMNAKDSVVSIGASPMTPGRFMVDLWEEVHEYCPGLDFQMVQYENTPEKEEEMLMNLGQVIDLYAGLFDQNFLKAHHCAALELKMTPVMVAVSIKHPLADKAVLEVEDLYGEQIMLIRHGWNQYIDEMREDILDRYPEIHIEDFEFLNLEAFNQCDKNKGIIMTVRSLREVHPLLKTIPVNWDYKIPFGLIFSKDPGDSVEQFLEAVQFVRGIDVMI